MRASASSAPSSLPGALALTDAKAAGSGTTVAASESSGTAAPGDRTADGSYDESAGQPFAAALASAQAQTGRRLEPQGRAVAAPLEQTRADREARPLAGEARQSTRTRTPTDAGPIQSQSLLSTRLVSAAVSPAATASAQTPTTVPVDSADGAPSAHGAPIEVEPKVAGPAKSTTTPSKSRTGKGLRTPPVLDGAAQAALTALLGGAAVPTSVTATAASGAQSSAQRAIRNAADAASTSAALPVAANQPQSHGSVAEAAIVSTATGRSATHGTAGVENNGASLSPLAAARIDSDHGTPGSAGTGLAPMLQGPNTVTNVATATPTASIGVPVAQSGWSNALAAQLQWMATRQVHSATLRLSPEHLGPLEVRIDVTRSQINVNFTAHHPDTREALAQAVPQLRQLFAAGGLHLGEANVRQEARSSEQSLLPQPPGATAGPETVEPVANAAIQRLGLVDEYA